MNSHLMRMCGDLSLEATALKYVTTEKALRLAGRREAGFQMAMIVSKKAGRYSLVISVSIPKTRLTYSSFPVGCFPKSLFPPSNPQHETRSTKDYVW